MNKYNTGQTVIFIDRTEPNGGLIEPSIYNELLLDQQIKETLGITGLF
jgi:hypothetical protein